MSAKSALNLLRDKYAERIVASDAVNWAVQELVEMRDGDALRRLAAVALPTDWSEIEPLLKQAYRELEYPWYEEEACYRACAKDIANDMVSGRIPPSAGSAELYDLFVALKYPPDLRVWDHITADLDPETMDDLSVESFPEIALKEAQRFLDGLQ